MPIGAPFFLSDRKGAVLASPRAWPTEGPQKCRLSWRTPEGLSQGLVNDSSVQTGAQRHGKSFGIQAGRCKLMAYLLVSTFHRDHGKAEAEVADAMKELEPAGRDSDVHPVVGSCWEARCKYGAWGGGKSCKPSARCLVHVVPLSRLSGAEGIHFAIFGRPGFRASLFGPDSKPTTRRTHMRLACGLSQ